jgi:hypothetical protein
LSFSFIGFYLLKGEALSDPGRSEFGHALLGGEREGRLRLRDGGVRRRAARSVCTGCLLFAGAAKQCSELRPEVGEKP